MKECSFNKQEGRKREKREGRERRKLAERRNRQGDGRWEVRRLMVQNRSEQALN